MQRIQVAWFRQGRLSAPVVHIAQDLSQGGLSIVSRSLVYPGTVGVVLLRKSNDDAMLRGLRVVHCRYIGNAEHFVGAQWIPLPDGLPVTIRLEDRGPVMVVRERV